MIMTDSPIRFPGLFGDWAFTASSKAINIGHGIYWYGIIIACGLLLAVAFCLRQRKHYGISEDDLMDCILCGIPCGIIGARLYYVIFYLDLFRDADGKFNWGKAVAIWDGGLAIYGAVIAVVILAVIMAKRKGFKLCALTDLVVMGLLIGQIVAKHRRFDGENTLCYFLWYGLGRFWIEGLRTDSLYLFDWTIGGAPIRVSQALSAVMVLVSAFLLVWNLWVKPHKPEELYVNIVAAREAAKAEETPEE